MLSECHRSEVRSTGSMRGARRSKFHRNRSPYATSAVTNVSPDARERYRGYFRNRAASLPYLETPPPQIWPKSLISQQTLVLSDLICLDPFSAVGSCDRTH